MKLESLALRDAPLLTALRCPLCGSTLTLAENRSLLCERRHCFDLSAKGYVNFAPGHDQNAEKYDAALFASRSRVFVDGYYTHVVTALCDAVTRWTGVGRDVAHADRAMLPAEVAPDAPLVVDAGCGDGYYARMLAASPLHPRVIGVDLSRDAIVAAARQAPAQHWMVADLTHLPFADASMDAVADVLTPADYREFGRILKPDGLLYKIIPADDYLAEIREAIADQLRGGAFSNARVVEHLAAHATVLERIPLRRTFAVTEEMAAHFLHMTPMTFGLNAEQLARVRFSKITVAMELLVCRIRRE